jgi:hypothetical protein
MTAASAAPAQDVVQAVAAALTARKPKTRYLAGKGRASPWRWPRALCLAG